MLIQFSLKLEYPLESFLRGKDVSKEYDAFFLQCFDLKPLSSTTNYLNVNIQVWALAYLYLRGISFPVLCCLFASSVNLCCL